MRDEREPLEDLIASFVERRESGEALDADAFAGEHPGREREILAALATLEEAQGLLPQAGADLPSTFGRYRVLSELGRGGMGRVLRVRDPEAGGQDLAVKVLNPRRELDPRAAERFRREGEILRSLAHDGIVRVLEVGILGASPFLVMELVEGRSLAALLDEARRAPGEPGPIPSDRLALPGEGPSYRRAAAIVARLARAVAAVHRAGALHRDLKPANAILAPDGRAVLIDFGMVHDESSETLTRTGDLLGTPQYMSPEQARGVRADDRTDVYGLGAILYELLTLRPPHTAEDPVRVLERVRSRKIVLLRRLAPGVPKELERVVHRALAHRRAHRTANAELLAADLEAFVAGRGVVAAPPSLLERAVDLWTFEKRWILAAAGAALLAILSIPALEMRARRIEGRTAARIEEVLGAWLAGKEDSAARAARTLLEEYSDHPFGPLLLALGEDRDPPDSKDPAAQAASEGQRKVRAKKTAEAVGDLQRASSLAPDSPVPVVLLARAADRSDDRALAAREYSAAAKMLPGCAAIQSRLAAVHYALKNDEESSLAARRAIELEPSNGLHWSMLARSLARDKKPTEESLEAARKGVELSGDSASTLQLSILAAGYDGVERHEEARVVYRRLIAKRPDDPRSHYNLAFSYMLDHHLPEARDAYLAGIQVGEGSRGKASLAWLYAGSNSAKCAECREAYAKNVELLDPDRAEALVLEALDANDSTVVPGLAVDVVRATGRKDAIRARIEAFQEKEQRDEMIVAFEKALRHLRP